MAAAYDVTRAGVGSDEKQYVGIDLHRRRSVIVRQTPAGEVLEQVRIDNDPLALAVEIAKAGPDPEVVLEATYGWYWAADVLAEAGATVHLAHPLGVKGWQYRRVKNDAKDAEGLADLLRMGRLPEAWIAPPAVRELRELIRHRAKLVAVRSGLKAQVHAVLAKEGVAVPMSDLFGKAGMQLLAEVKLGRAYRLRVASLIGLIDAFDYEATFFTDLVAEELRGHHGYRVIQRLHGVGPVFASVFVAELGDVTRFRDAAAVCSWAGLTPRHRESDSVVHRGAITKQGSRLVRWAAVEAAQKLPALSKLAVDRDRIAVRRGRNIAKVAVARRLLTLVYYGLRDGHLRCLEQREAAA